MSLLSGDERHENYNDSADSFSGPAELSARPATEEKNASNDENKIVPDQTQIKSLVPYSKDNPMSPPPPAEQQAPEEGDKTAKPEESNYNVKENSSHLPKEIAEKYNVVVLASPYYGDYKFCVGSLLPLNNQEKREVSLALFGHYETTSIKFNHLAQEDFERLFAEAYETANLMRIQQRREQDSTREARDFGGETGKEQIRAENKSFDHLFGKRFNITDLAWYYDTRDKLDRNEITELSLSTYDFVKFLFQDFLLSGSSDLHLHSMRGGGRIRYRSMGKMYLRFDNIPPHRFQRIVFNICTLSGKDTSRMKDIGIASVVKLQGLIDNAPKDIEFRFQSIPTLHNPTIVMRGHPKPLTDINKVGYLPNQLADVFHILKKSDRGVLLTTGETGSGKTNTLNCCSYILEENDELAIGEIGAPIEIESNRRFQITLQESPIESQNELIRLKTFADMMRCDPDVIIYTEIRTPDETKVAFRAAVTGHLVLTTLHANDVEATFNRLFEMGIDRSIIAKGTLGIISQTLVRVLCQHCRLDDEEGSILAQQKIYRENPAGCQHCDRGIKGMTVIAEVLRFNPEIRRMINENYKPADIVQRAVSQGYMMPMRKVALTKLLAGITSQSEIDNILELQTSVDPNAVNYDFDKYEREGETIYDGELVE